MIFVPLLLACIAAEQAGNPLLAHLGVDQSVSATQSGGNMEGKETRFGIVNSALWATATTAASNGSVNAMHDSFTPLGGLVPMWMIQLGEVIFGGVGSGLYGMLMFAVIAVFIAGLMIGRTPEYLGKKIEAFEMKMACLVMLVPPLAGAGRHGHRGVVRPGKAGVANPGAHGFSEILYAFSLGRQQQRQRLRRAVGQHAVLQHGAGHLRCSWRGIWLIMPVLAIAGSLAAKKPVPAWSRHAAHAYAAVRLLLVGGDRGRRADFLPALALGPIVEQLMSHQWGTDP